MYIVQADIHRLFVRFALFESHLTIHATLLLLMQFGIFSKEIFKFINRNIRLDEKWTSVLSAPNSK